LDTIENNELEDSNRPNPWPPLHHSNLKGTIVPKPDDSDLEDAVEKLMIEENKIPTDDDQIVRKELVKTIAAGVNHDI